MGAVKTAVLLALTAAAINFYFQHKPSLPTRIDGMVDPKFKKVQAAFRQNFADGWEHEGVAFAVYHNGKLVVDLWGGYADENSMREWKRDTMTTVFSCTKALASLTIAKLVDDGHLSYDDLVTKYWPNFGKHDKANVTVRMLVSHQAGLATVDQPIKLEDVATDEAMSKLFEEQKPLWPPGTMHGYHALTHGYLLQQIVKRADPKHRSLGQFFHEEIQSKTGDEKCFIGLPESELYNVARITYASVYDELEYMLQDPNFALFNLNWRYGEFMHKYFDKTSIFTKVLTNPPWLLDLWGRMGFNNPDVWRMEIPAGGAICTARGLAQAFNALLQGKLLSAKTRQMIEKPVSEGVDFVFKRFSSMGLGFFFTKSPKGDTLIGHPGFGGQNVKYDAKNNLVFAYISNGLKAGLGENCRPQKRLVKALYDSL